MKKFYSIVFLLVMLSLSKANSQTIQLEKQLILGTWVSAENDLSWVFENDTICKEYFAKQLEAKYLYNITPADSYCGRLSKVDKKDRSISFLELKNLATKEVTCFEINGVNKTTLSITEYMMPGPAIFRRKNISGGKKK